MDRAKESNLPDWYASSCWKTSHKLGGIAPLGGFCSAAVQGAETLPYPFAVCFLQGWNLSPGVAEVKDSHGRTCCFLPSHNLNVS